MTPRVDPAARIGDTRQAATVARADIAPRAADTRASRRKGGTAVDHSAVERSAAEYSAPMPSAAVRRTRWVQHRVVDVAAVVGVAAVVLLLAGLLLGVRPAVVVSGSMAPEIPVGSLLATRTVPADSVEVGDVVTVPRPRADGLVTHRVVSTEPSAEAPGATRLELQGDANAHPDALPYVLTEVGHVGLAVPGLGFAVLALQDNLFLVVVALVVSAALVAAPVGRDRLPVHEPVALMVDPAGSQPRRLLRARRHRLRV